ncbi:MAG TPA: hypothetical protein VLY04_25565 [Bryobacteraceae bacterium]|nr:hypothetical protein [Bryobacteraceae bacterium]
MKIGADDKKKVAWLIVLGLGAAYAVYSNLSSGTPSGPAVRTSSRVAAPPETADTGAAADAASGGQRVPRPGIRDKNQEFRPVLHPKRKEDQIDTSKVDPTLRLDLLAKVQAVPPAGGERDLFQILRTPPVKQLAQAAEPKVIPFVGPRQPPPPPGPPGPQPEPPPPPIPLKYYGFCTEINNGRRTAYFLDGDDILQAGEGSTLKGRYRVVRIGLSSVTMEDVQVKRQQNLSLEPEAAG